MLDTSDIPLRVKILVGITIIGLIVVLVASFVKYLYTKDYYFFVEAPCDVGKENCFVRDCDNYCPPNGLASYSIYKIKAKDFEGCTTNACLQVCENSTVCEKIACDSELGDSCSRSE